MLENEQLITSLVLEAWPWPRGSLRTPHKGPRLRSWPWPWPWEKSLWPWHWP